MKPDPDFSFGHGEPDGSLLTINRALHVSHPLVLACLVNVASIEKAVLIETRYEGRSAS